MANDARIERALVTPGHDGSAELLLRIRYENGALGTVTLGADAAARLLDRCGADTLEQLVGEPWQQLIHVLDGTGGPSPWT